MKADPGTACAALVNMRQQDEECWGQKKVHCKAAPATTATCTAEPDMRLFSEKYPMPFGEVGECRERRWRSSEVFAVGRFICKPRMQRTRHASAANSGGVKK